MGNLHLNPNCINLPKSKISTVSVNTDSTLSTPLISLLSSTTSSFNVTVSVSQNVVDLQQILSNYCKENYSSLSKIPSSSNSAKRIDECKYTKNYNLHKKLVIECDQQMTFYIILKEFHLIQLLDINTIKVCIIDELYDEIEVENLDETIYNVLKLSSNTSEYHYHSSIHISLREEWYSNELIKISEIETLIDNVLKQTHKLCKTKKIKHCKSLQTLQFEYDIINNDILSLFVDIDAMIDDHGNDIANLESSVLPYLSTNKNRMLKLLTKKLNKMEDDLRSVALKWSLKSKETEQYLQKSLNKGIEKMFKKYKLWTTEQVIEWIQYILKDNIIFNDKDIERLKIANIAGINIINIDHGILELIGIKDEYLQNFIITSVQNLIKKYDEEIDVW